MNYSNIIIVTYGRSGSTLLMGLLNSMPSSHIKGENFDLVYRLYLSYKSLMETKQYSQEATEPEHPWYGASTYNSEKFFGNIQKIINDLLSDGTDPKISVRGFKEIRYFDSFDSVNFPGYLDFLEAILDSPLFLLNTRNHQDVANSGWWKGHDSVQLTTRLQNFEDKIRSECAMKHNFYEIDMSDITSKSNRLFGLFEKIGVDPESVPIDAVVSKRHSTA